MVGKWYSDADNLSSGLLDSSVLAVVVSLVFPSPTDVLADV